MVKNGMEDAVAAINDAYGYKKDDAITMTFEEWIMKRMWRAKSTLLTR